MQVQERLPIVAVFISLLMGRTSLAFDTPQFKPGPVGQAAVERLSKHLEEVQASYNLPAMAAAVIVDGRPIAVAAVGERKIGSGRPVSENDLFHLGSCTKAMTAFLVARLIEEGHFRYEDRIRVLCPKLRVYMHRDYSNLTLQQCLLHRGGFVGQDATYDRIPKTSLRLREARARFDYAHRMLNREPLDPIGTRYRYSNVGYTVAALAAETKLHKPWEELMQKYVYGPLRMRSVGYGAPGTASRIDQPWPHRYDSESRKHIPIRPGPAGDNAELITPAARAHCSMSDWAGFAAEILRTYETANSKSDPESDSLLGPEAARKLLTSPYERGRYAGGWKIGFSRVYGNVLSHDGSNTLNHALAYLLPDRNFAVLVATNSGHTSARTACNLVQIRAIADWVFGGMDPADLSRESYRANMVFQWIARIQNKLLERGKRYLAPKLYAFLASPEGEKLCEELRGQGKPQKIEFLGRRQFADGPGSVYRVTFSEAVWIVEFDQDRKRVTQRLNFRRLQQAGPSQNDGGSKTGTPDSAR